MMARRAGCSCRRDAEARRDLPRETPCPTPRAARAPRRAGAAAGLALAACLLAGGAALPARADRGDRDQPTRIEADSQRLDDLRQVSVFTGNVVLTRGTLRVTGERLEFREDPEGYQHAHVTAAPGQRATFSQRRDPLRPQVEETVEGEAERIIYDGRTERIHLSSGAVVRRLENGVPRDELAGETIVYDARNETYEVAGAPAARPGDPAGRVRTVIAPRRSDEAAAPDPLPLTPARPAAPAPAPSAAPR